MAAIRIPLWILLWAFSTPVVSKAAFLLGCRDAFQHLTGTRQEPLREGRVAILEYPLHAKIAVDNQIFESLGRYFPTENLEKMERASRQGGTPFFKLGFRATDAELERLKADVGDDRARFQSCISGACRAVNNNLGFTIPPLVRWSPAATLAYLYLIKKAHLDHGRIESIELLPNSPEAALHHFGSALSEALLVTSLSVALAAKVRSVLKRKSRSDASVTETEIEPHLIRVVPLTEGNQDPTPVKLNVIGKERSLYIEDATHYDFQGKPGHRTELVTFYERDSQVYAEWKKNPSDRPPIYVGRVVNSTLQLASNVSLKAYAAANADADRTEPRASLWLDR